MELIVSPQPDLDIDHPGPHLAQQSLRPAQHHQASTPLIHLEIVHLLDPSPRAIAIQSVHPPALAPPLPGLGC